MAAAASGLNLSVKQAAAQLGVDITNGISFRRDLISTGQQTWPISLRPLLFRQYQTHPVLLLPLRLETRYRDSKLLIRIYPDQIALDSHRPRLSEEEGREGLDYHEALREADQDGDPAEAEDARRAAWRGLAARFGPQRAAWIVRTTDGINGLTEVSLRDPDQWAAPIVRMLPTRFAAFLYHQGPRGTHRLWNGPVLGTPVRRSLSLIATPTDTQASLFDSDSRWMVDYPRAVEDGMAITVDLSNLAGPEREFSRIIVVGLRSTNAAGGRHALERLIDSHHYTKGFAFLKDGTPTNNTEQAPSGHSKTEEDRERSYQTEIVEPQGIADPHSNHSLLARALGLGVDGAVLTHIERAGDRIDGQVADLHRALWPATGRYMVDTLLQGVVPDGDLGRLGPHVEEFLRPGGPLPAVRAGDQPYGILPVTRIRRRSGNHLDGWEVSPLDNGNRQRDQDTEDGIQRIVAGLFDVWLEWAHDERRVPRIGTTEDPDQELLQILSMEPISRSYRLRPFLCDRFIGWLLFCLRWFVFARSPFNSTSLTAAYWVGRWAWSWNRWRWGAARYWESITNRAWDLLEFQPLLRMFGWSNSSRLAIPLIGGTEEHDLPAVYLRDLHGSTTSEAAGLLTDTLLFDLLLRSRILAQSAPGNLAASVQESIDRLATAAEAGTLDLDRLFPQFLDLFTSRLDAWATAHASKRLEMMRRDDEEGILIGAFGWAEDLAPREKEERGLFIHTPSRGQAAAAAVLHNAYLTHDYDQGSSGSSPNPFSINLNSQRVRRSMRVLEGVRQGQQLGALLGYQFERGLHEAVLDWYIDDFRRAFPLVATKEQVSEQEERDHADSQPAPPPDDPVEAMAARNVVDGLQLVRWWRDRNGFRGTAPQANLDAVADIIQREPAVRAQVIRLNETLDGISDLLVHESVYQTAQQNYDRAGAALEAAAGNAHPPDIESITTPVSGRLLGHRVCLLFPIEPAAPVVEGDRTLTADLRGEAEPRIAAWLARLYGPLDAIGCRYEFQTPRLNVNEATQAQLAAIPGVSDGEAKAILEARRRPGGFKTLEALQRLVRLSDAAAIALSRWAMTGSEETEEERHYRRLDINTADFDELVLVGLSELEAERMVVHRQDIGPFRRLDALADLLGGAQVTLDRLRAFITTGVADLSIEELGISPSDLFYLSSIPPDGEETEIEQRIRSFVRREFGLQSDVPIHIELAAPAGYDRGMDLTLELGRHLLTLLQSGRQLRPSLLRLPAEAEDATFGEAELDQFHRRCMDILGRLATMLGATPAADNDRAIYDWLLQAARFGVSGAVPAAPGDPRSRPRFLAVQDELRRRHRTTEQKIRLVIEDPNRREHEEERPNDSKIERLLAIMEDLFGGGFIMLPEFTASDGEALDQSLGHGDLVGDDAAARIRLWLRQSALVRPALPGLEDGLMLTEAWQQSSAQLGTPALGLAVAQLPFDPEDRWLALDDSERGRRINETGSEGRGRISIVAAVADGESLTPLGGRAAQHVAGLLLDQWDELIPSDIVDTSLAIQYDAPSTQAPQSILVAVPPRRNDPMREWTVEDLAGIVGDTLDLAKVRAIDLDAMRRIGRASMAEEAIGSVFPALFFPVGRDRPHWERDGVQTIEDWVDGT